MCKTSLYVCVCLLCFSWYGIVYRINFGGFRFGAVVFGFFVVFVLLCALLLYVCVIMSVYMLCVCVAWMYNAFVCVCVGWFDVEIYTIFKS